jgi:hypothetical protein
LNKNEKTLLKYYQQLPSDQQSALSDYAEWLVSRHGQIEEVIVATEPLDIPRPSEESVVKAIRRLSDTYPMLDTSEMLTKTSSFMTRHVMEGLDSAGVIDEMEDYFRECYEKQFGDAKGG